MKYSSDPNLGEGLCIFTSFHFPDCGFYLLNDFDLIFFYLFHWRPTENPQWDQSAKNIPCYDPTNVFE